MTSPYFSVVIPAYNAEQTIVEALESVLAQTETDFEVIVIDDGSTDETLHVLLKRFAGNERIRIASQPNSGVAVARNFGVSEAHGELIAFMDADDIWHPEKLARHASIHTRQPDLAASFARVCFCSDSEGQLRAGRTKSSVPERDCRLEDVIIENVVCTMSNLVLKRTAFNMIGGFDSTMRHVEDQDLLARLLGQKYRLLGIPETLVGYRMSESGLSCDFGSMMTAWKNLASRWSSHIDIKRGEALYCRYLARRALRCGASAKLAREFVRRGFTADRRAFLSDGKRGLLTTGGAMAGGIIPARARKAIFA